MGGYSTMHMLSHAMLTNRGSTATHRHVPTHEPMHNISMHMHNISARHAHAPAAGRRA
jgi:hypothetical protein